MNKLLSTYTLRLFLLLMASILLSSAVLSVSGQTADTFSHGSLEGNIYNNDFFGITLPLPNDWYFVDKDKRTILTKNNADKFSELGEAGKEFSDSYENTNVANIFTLFKYPPDSILEVNPNITLIAMNIKDTPDLQNLDQVIEMNKKELRSVGFKVSPETLNYSIGEKKFIGLNSLVNFRGMKAQYDSYVSNFGDYNLLLTISYGTDAQKEELYKMIEKMLIQ